MPVTKEPYGVELSNALRINCEKLSVIIVIINGVWVDEIYALKNMNKKAVKLSSLLSGVLESNHILEKKSERSPGFGHEKKTMEEKLREKALSRARPSYYD